MKTDNTCINRSILLYSIICFLATSWAFTDDKLSPVLTIVKAKSTPSIDGKINPKEWEYAAEVTGFADLYGYLSTEDTKAYVTYNESGVYVAISSIVANTPRGKVRKQDDTGIFYDDTVEVRFKPESTQDKWFLFVVNSKGSICDAKVTGKNIDFSWNGKWKVKTTVKDSGENVGGVETFAKSFWQVEMMIPYADLETVMPKNGEKWKGNFTCNVYKGEPSARTEDTRWTSWSPAVGSNFNDLRGFGTIYFNDAAPVIKIVSLGNFVEGNLFITTALSNYSRRPIKLNSKVDAVTDETKKLIFSKLSSLMLDVSSSLQFQTGKFAALATATPLKFTYEFSDSNGKILNRNTYNVTVQPAFRCNAILLYSQHILAVNCDISRVNLPEKFSARAEVIKKDGNVTVQSFDIKELSALNKKYTVPINIADFEPGKYIVRIYLQDGKNVITTRDEEVLIPQKPVWLNNRLGISSKVPTPWTPVAVKGNTVCVWGRDYEFSDSPFPSQIINQRTGMLQKPIELEIDTNHGKIQWDKSQIERVSSDETKAVFRITNESAALKIVSNVEIEYDGFIRVDFTLSPTLPTVITKMALHIAIKKASALYMKGMQFYPQNLAYAACLYDGAKGGVVHKNIWTFSANGWLWPKDFMHYIWVGGDKTGLSVAFDSDKGFYANNYVSVVSQQGAKEININFIDKPYELKKPAEYTVALHATPAKPLPNDPKRFHFGSVYVDPPIKTVYKGLYAGAHGGGLDNGPAYPGLNMHGKKIVKHFWDAEKVRVFPDGSYWWCTMSLPEYKMFGPEWDLHPKFLMNYRNVMVSGVCRKGSYTDYLLWSFNKRIDEGVRGLYSDGANLTPCDSELHGCGYVNDEGKRVASVNLFGTRETYKRIYTLFKTRVPDSFIYVHNVPVSPLASFADGTCEGESWDQGDYSNLLPDLFRAGFATYNQLGTPFTLYSFLSYGWRYGDGKAPVPPLELLPITISFNMYPSVAGPGTDNNVGMIHLTPIWEIMDEWYTSSEWIPFWKSEGWAKSSNSDVKVSIYFKDEQKKALLIVANLEKEKITATVHLDLTKFGLTAGKYKLTRITPAKMRLSPDLRPIIESPMMRQNVTLSNATLNVSLPRRSMEFYLLESK